MIYDPNFKPTVNKIFRAGGRPDNLGETADYLHPRFNNAWPPSVVVGGAQHSARKEGGQCKQQQPGTKWEVISMSCRS